MAELFTQAVNRMQSTPHSAVAALKKLKQNPSDLEIDEVRDELKQEISTELKHAGIPSGMMPVLTRFFVSTLMKGISVVHAEPGK